MNYLAHLEKLRRLEDRSDRPHHNGEYTFYESYRM